jgi:hypothetical protein
MPILALRSKVAYVSRCFNVKAHHQANLATKILSRHVKCEPFHISLNEKEPLCGAEDSEQGTKSSSYKICIESFSSSPIRGI